MRFSTRGHYGLMAMVALAQRYNRGAVALAEVARAEGLSLAYLEQLAMSLRRAGLITSVRGAKGGYRLSADPSQVKVGQVLRALDGPLAPVECVSEVPSSHHCGREVDCLSRPLWERLRDSVSLVMDSTTLADLCRGAKEVSCG
ncbi:MAG: Rrf2 family transcriptional regulator [Chloroflexi bacterium]|nr:Rrf2 family transcriptional regulator [Chloroflexota bacterium]